MTQQACGYCAVTILIPRICSAEIIPSALVKENCVSTFEFSRMNPSPSSVSGGTTMRKDLAPKVRERFETSGLPVSANRAISARCGFNASARHSPKTPFCIIHDTDTPALQGTWQERTRSWRSRRFGLVGSSRRAGLARSATFRSWLPGSTSTRSASCGWGANRVEEFGPLGRTSGIGHIARDEDRIQRIFGVKGSELRQRFLSRSLPRGPDRPLSMRKP